LFRIVMMKRPALIALCVLAVISAGWLMQGGKTGAAPPVSTQEQPSAAVTAQSSARLNERRAAEAQVNPGSLPSPAPASSPEEKEQRFDAINAAATTYAPEGIRDIKPYLLDPDAEIRLAAKDGLIVLGEAGGASALRAAAKQLKDPREAAVFLEAADYLELPSWSDTEEAQILAGQIPAPAPVEPAPDQQQQPQEPQQQ
jgi:HEAT repeat protein